MLVAPKPCVRNSLVATSRIFSGSCAALSVRAYVRPVAVGDALPEMPLFLEPNGCVQAPLEVTYQTAFASMPRRWRQVLESGT